MRILLTMSALFATLASCIAPPIAEAQITDSQKAVVAFEVYVDRLTSSDVARETGMENPANSLSVEGSDALQLDEIRRVYGAASAPADVAKLQAAMNDPEFDEFLLEFFVRLQYKSNKAAEIAFADIASEGQPETIGETEYVRLPDGSEDVPKNTLAHLSAPDTIEIGTDAYLLLPNRNVFTDHLSAAWPKMPKAAVRIGIDLDGARQLIDEALEIGREQDSIPSAAQPAITLLNDISVLRVGLDFSGDNLLWLTATGRDADTASRINGILGGLTAMAKGFGQQALPMAPTKAQGPAKEILDALATTIDGHDVNITVPRPEGLEEAMSELFGQMMMAGMGGDELGADAFGPPSGLDAMPGGEADPFGDPAPADDAADGADPFGF